MDVLIIESELYLAQSIASKLIEKGYNVEIGSPSAPHEKEYSIVLISTSIADFTTLIKQYKEAIVILLNSYNSNDTVATPLGIGADDYVLKPFLMDELLRKIEHQMRHKQYIEENHNLKNINNFLFRDISFVSHKPNFPLLIKTISQVSAELFVGKLAFLLGLKIEFVDIATAQNYDFNKPFRKELVCVINFNKLKLTQKNALVETLKNKVAVFVSFDLVEKYDAIESIELKPSNNPLGMISDIMSIDDYVRYIIELHQIDYPDTELSKKLGISRKSLWEKRKKYGLQKKK